MTTEVITIVKFGIRSPFPKFKLVVKILGSSPMCMKPQKQQKKIIHQLGRHLYLVPVLE